MNTEQQQPLPDVEKPDSIRELGPVDITELKLWVSRLSETIWNQEDERKENKFPCFHHTRHIVFRFIPSNRDPRESYANPIWHLCQGILLPLFEKAIAPYGFSQPVFPKAMLARVAAGHIIDRHVDGAGSNLKTHKIHIPLSTNPDAFFCTEKDRFHLEEGIAYEVNNIKPHGVENRGDTDRNHLIFEVYDQAV
ncbi:aspartyl/asparaginyl beta-hydroxylase domain-containing protein [Puniceicoccaceae bacterium K14]|nr:aspartyl/asparaginyl beta-hydroxylase domain-containing protein [Puniceicoccaceae bacterium K14]